MFCQCGFKGLKVLEIGHARRVGNLNREIKLNDEYLSQFLSDCKVLWMTLEQLVETNRVYRLYSEGWQTGKELLNGLQTVDRKLVIRKAPGSIPAENTSPQIHMDLST